jgi:phage tail sheath protein FI
LDYDTSYAATYYPPVRLRDTVGGGNDVTVVAPSVAAIGAMAFSDANSQGPWFAPAGFNRGGIGVLGGSAGPRVVGTVEHLTKRDRDDLYEQNVNPIARFPAVGEIVIFGQKTLQQTPSALDRINVRRLMIYLKKRIGRVANTILFDQNVQTTWFRFKDRADAILSDVKSRFGITEYKLVLDETTTTADLVDRNIMYAKIFIKPARAIEFIAIDFVITRSGVEF